jgi:hypothetical protein
MSDTKSMAARYAAWWKRERLLGREAAQQTMRAAAGDDVAVRQQLVRIDFEDGSVFLERWKGGSFSDAIQEHAE